MARSQQTASRTSRYPRRQRATPAPSYSDISESSRSLSPAPDVLGFDTHFNQRARMMSRVSQCQRTTPAPSYSNLTDISQPSSPIPQQTRSRYPRRVTPAPSWSDIREPSRPPSLPAELATTEVGEKTTSELWPTGSSMSNVFCGSQSFKPLNESDDTVVTQPAHLPIDFFNICQTGLPSPQLAASPTSLKMSVLTWLSHIPPLPSELENTLAELTEAGVATVALSELEAGKDESLGKEVVEEVAIHRREANSRLLSKRRCTQTSSDDVRPTRKAKITATSQPMKKTIPTSSCTVSSVRSRAATGNWDSLGALTKLPQEIRQEIFAYALDEARAVTTKQCCGPASTKREQDICKAHGKIVVLDTGRLNLLRVSNDVAEEASWVLYNRGRLKLELGKKLSPYFANYRPKSLRRLGKIPDAMKVKAMWMTVARYRFVELSIPRVVLRYSNPETYTENMYEIASLLLKSWEKEVHQPTSEVPHTVTISLRELFEEIVPFNTIPSPDMDGELYFWSSLNFPGEEPDLLKIATNSGNNFMRLISIVRHNRGLSEWKMVALSEIDEESEGYKWLMHVRRECAIAGIAFEGLTKEKMASE